MTIARRRILLGLGAVIGAPSWLAGTPAVAEIRFGEELRHANGLRTAVPEGYSMDESPEGFMFRLTASTRAMNWIAVARSATLPQLMPVDEVIAKGETYLIEAGGGGSGGTEYLLSTWKASGGAFIVVTAVEQMELGTPTFDAGWAVFERSTLEGG
jgi:hypothetical protein